MQLRRNLVLAAACALLVPAAYAAKAAPVVAVYNAAAKDRVMRQLDEAAKNFHTTAADFEFDSVQTDPIFDKEVQTGAIYYERTGSTFRMAAHIRAVDGKPTPKVYVYSNGVFRLYEERIDQVTTLSKVSQYQSYLMLGFGASGREIEKEWNVTYLGPEMLDGVETAKLELVPKDPAILKNLPRVTLWIDPVRDVSLKQVFDEGPGQYRVSVYFNLKLNQPLPGDAFSFKTDRKTQYVNR